MLNAVVEVLFDIVVSCQRGCTCLCGGIIIIQCNLDYPDLVYPGPRLAGDQKIHYHACAEGVANDHLCVWSQVER